MASTYARIPEIMQQYINDAKAAARDGAMSANLSPEVIESAVKAAYSKAWCTWRDTYAPAFHAAQSAHAGMPDDSRLPLAHEAGLKATDTLAMAPVDVAAYRQFGALYSESGAGKAATGKGKSATVKGQAVTTAPATIPYLSDLVSSDLLAAMATGNLTHAVLTARYEAAHVARLASLDALEVSIIKARQARAYTTLTVAVQDASTALEAARVDVAKVDTMAGILGDMLPVVKAKALEALAPLEAAHKTALEAQRTAPAATTTVQDANMLAQAAHTALNGAVAEASMLAYLLTITPEAAPVAPEAPVVPTLPPPAFTTPEAAPVAPEAPVVPTLPPPAFTTPEAAPVAPEAPSGKGKGKAA